METGKGRAERQGVRPWLALLIGLAAGCATGRNQLDQALQATTEIRAEREAAAESYLVGCPDVLELVVAQRPGLGGLYAVDPDGCVKVVGYGRVQVEGRTVGAVTQEIAGFCHLAPKMVQVRVAEYRSQQLFLVGQVVGLPRAVPYEGPETVLELLRRVGGVRGGAAFDHVYVVRSQVAEGRSPEVYRVDLRAMLLHHDERTNIRLQPFDQIFVGESRPCCLEKCVPPWLRPAYELFFGMRPSAIGYRLSASGLWPLAPDDSR